MSAEPHRPSNRPGVVSSAEVASATLVETLRHRAALHPRRVLYRFLKDGEAEETVLTYGELDRRARALAVELREAGAAGERALLLYPPGLELIVAFMGCLYGGVVAVPAYPPRLRRADPRLQAILEDARPRFALATRALASRAALLAERHPPLGSVRWWRTEDVDPGQAELWRPAEDASLQADSTAFLQYTSGSTSSPRGVEVSHRNLVNNERMIQAAFGQTESSVIVGWLPPYHDMGLIGNLLQPLWAGATSIHMSPAAFLRRPARWLEAISRYRATTSGGPDFAYELCARKVGPEDRRRLDLGSWRVAFSGAEPVRASTLDRFAETFASCGFRREAFYPCYGLAEATLFVGGGDLDRPPVLREVDAESLRRGEAAAPRREAAARTLVGCGRPWSDQRVVVVDPEERVACPEGKVGEIWVAGGSVARGYWNRPEETSSVFGAQLCPVEVSRLHDGYLRTGDLGFLAEGELFVTGRRKDLIILRGCNHYPQDIELTAERSHPALRPGGGAAFAVEEEGEERLVVVHEVEHRHREDPEALVRAITRAVAEEHEVAVAAVHLLAPGRLPRTSSGKVRRRACKADLLAGRLETLAAWKREAVAGDAGEGPRTPLEEQLAALWCEVFERDRIAVGESFFELGGDSLRATRLLARIEETFGVALAPEDVFDHPTLAGLAARLEEEDAPPADLSVPPLRTRDRSAASSPAPLTFAQRRLWFLHQLDPDNPVHNIAAVATLEGRLDEGALERALAEVARRHGMLRTRFGAGGAEPVQVVEPRMELTVARVDLVRLGAERSRAESRRLAVMSARRPFELGRAPLWTAALVRRGRERHDLVLAFHHIVADGGSLDVFLRELTALYAAFRKGRPSPLPALGLQYAEFARWQRRVFDDERLAADLAWWRRRLGGEPPTAELPADRPRPAVLSFRGAHLERRLRGPLPEALRKLADSSGATLFMVHLAVFQALFHRWTGARDLVVGSPVAGRNRVDIEGLVGVFLNNLVIRIRTSGGSTFSELLAQVRATALAAYAHQELPFEKLAEALQPAERDLSRAPLFQVLFVGQNAPLRKTRLPGLVLRPREVDPGTARFDLALAVAPADEGWLGTWKYSTDLFDASTIARMAGCFERLLLAAAARPDRPLGELGLMSPAEHHQALLEWNDTTRPWPPAPACLHQLVAGQVRRTPEAVALSCAAAQLSYRELERQAGALAWRLLGLGVGPESRVGIFLERSLELVTALLATLGSGGAWVPFDPDEAPERLASTLEDAGVAVILTDRHLEPRLPAQDTRVLRVELFAEVPRVARPVRVRPENPAYVIYTSGSTGRPKGVAVPHSGIVNRLRWMQEAYRLGAGDRVLQKTPYTFDVSVWEFFWPLAVGARLILAPPGAHRDGRRLAEIVREHRVTTLHFVPSMLRVFLDTAGAAACCGTVKRLITSGEALSTELRDRATELGAASVHNLYGPTEASVDVTFHRCTAGSPPHTVPIGRPIANTRIHLLDAGLGLVPHGAAGVLYIAGTGLARGYAGRRALTAERFVPDPTAAEAGGRLYDTGDLARYRAGGEIEFLGRVDHQVKVRGFRIELGEIEAALVRHAGVHQAAVVARQDPSGSRLVAWLVTAEPAPTVAELRGFLRRGLPEYMVPSAFGVLGSLPMTVSGKLDRKELARLGLPGEGEGGESSPTPPRTALERLLASLWQEVLGVGALGVDDNFFELGGDSIRGAILVNRLQQELGEVLYVMALFDAPTVRRLAGYLEERYGEAVARRLGVEAPVPEEVRRRASRAAQQGAEVLREAVARRLGRRPGEVPDWQDGGERLRPAVFLLSPFRSGSTLLRVMLAGHSRLFAPPELELLGFGDLAARRDAYRGRDSFAREGLLRAVMELDGGDADGAREIVGRHEDERTSVRDFYGLLQSRIGERLLVDKTPSYSLDPATLEHAESLFDAPRYIHLTRHPLATIHSYVEARMDRVYGFPLPPREQAELVWWCSHRNILDFLGRVDPERQLSVRFEDLVRTPRAVMEQVSGFLGLEYEPAMLEPYTGRRMTDGLHAESRMMGDPKFHRHTAIDASVAERWRGATVQELGEAAAELAHELGYGPDGEVAAPLLPLAPRRRDSESEISLSFAQERLWFLDQLDPGSPVYNMPAAVHLEGELDTAALAAGFAGLVERHEVLRTSFPEVGGRPVQRISSAAPPALACADLSALGPAAREAESRRQALHEGRRPFDLRRGPMVRTLLLRLGEHEHLLLVTLHHAVSDGWSIGILVRELKAFYESFSRAEAPALPRLGIQYADYAVWQRRWLESGVLERQLEYWHTRLAGSVPALDLPTDRPRPPRLTFDGARLSRTLRREELEMVRGTSGRQGSTLFMTLLAAFKALLHRYSGQLDLSLGVPNANRNRREIENLIGFFLNMVTVRTDLGGWPSFRDLLERVTAGFVDSLPYQEAPFEKVVERLQPKRDLSRPPLFQVQFSLQNTPSETLELPGLTLRPLEIHNRTTKFDFTVFLFDEPQGLVTTLEYNTDLFDAASMGRLLGHWQTLLVDAAARPEKKLGDLLHLRAAELSQLLREWNGPRLVPPDPACLHRLFEARVDEDPARVAAVFEVEELTYGQLDERANQLARRLRALGVGPESRVGLALEGSLPLVMAMVAILKAGGAYVPLDPSYPPDRLAFAVEDALAGDSPAVLVTETRFAQRFSGAGRACRILCLDAESESLARESRERPRVEVTAENLAYVIYTSGSTGRPKGVEISHANVARLFTAAEPWFGFGPHDVWTLFHSPAFDFSVWEIWGALAHGGSLVVVPREIARNPESFYELLGTEQVTVLNQTPSAFRQLIAAEDEGGRPLRLRRVIFGGEALDPADLEPWIARHGDSSPEIVNMYGITETTVHVTWRRVTRRDLAGAVSSPIGFAVPDLEVHLLSAAMELRPAGLPGEIHVGGPGLARGYLGRPALTARRFVPDPFAARAGTRLYKSGDLARRRHGGELEYLGRIDQQVKIRGHRIELGEIEAALSRHPGVREAATCARAAGTGEAELTAYFVPRGEAPTTGELRRHLASFLPEYMMPRSFLPLERLPLTPSGKLDRKALPDPASSRPSLDQELVAPRTPLERRLAEIWCDVLELETVGIHDDFFELGGHSLLATRVSSRAREVLGFEIRLRELFENPTVAGLAARFEAEAPAGVAPGSSIPAGSLTGDLPLSFSQERLWLLSQMRESAAAFNLFAPLHLTGRLDVGVLEASLAEIVHRHAALRTIFVTVEGRPCQRLLPAAGEEDRDLPRLPVADLEGLDETARGETAAILVDEESRRPFDLARGPLFRAGLVRLGAEHHLLLLNMHHIVSDGWSMGVMVRELNALYQALAAGRPSPLAPLPIQYADFARWQREELRGPVLEEHLFYWRGRFSDGGQVLDLPTDRPRPPVKGFRGSHHYRRLADRSLRRLEPLCAEEGATRFMLMLAALAVVLQRYSGQDDVTVGTFIANRNRPETEGLIGFFVNNLALRVDLGGTPSFRRLLLRVKELTLSAYSHQDLPFEKLLAELELDRVPNRTPLFQVMLVLQNAPLPALRLPGLEGRLVQQERGRANFDLTLWLEQDLDAFLEYDLDLFEASTIRRMLVHFDNVLAGAAARPETPVRALDLLSEAERHQLLRAWNDTAEDARFTAVHEQTAARAERSPHAAAVVAGDRTLSYGELDARAERLARHLCRLGIGPECVVALFVERTPEMVVALLGVLKAGAAYLPLDPLHPPRRLALLLDGSCPAAVLTRTSLAGRLPAVAVPILDLDEVLAAEGPGERQPLPHVAPRQLAYLIHTSGSTGRPKAVMVSHGALANFTRTAVHGYELSREDRVLQFASITFDASAEEIFPTLARGAALVLRDEECAASAVAFLAFCSRERLSVLDLPTAFWHEIADSLAASAPASVRLVILGGERALPERVGHWRRVAGDSPALVNTYGPTEATVVATTWRVRSAAETVPLGKAVGNLRVYVVDRDVRCLPMGARGELAISGAGLARGYRGRPGSSAERFVPDPFSRRPGSRLYLTGDRARHLPATGDLDFQGRGDDQVKVRGYRIELGEIEAALAEHPRVTGQVVTAPHQETGNRRLVAYVVTSCEAGEIRDFLAERLARYMVPSAVVVLENLPRTVTGKVDRRALPSPEESWTGRTDSGYAAPETEIEQLLATAWAEVLGIERVSRSGNFFELGGDSILAIRVVARARQAGVEVTAQDLFRCRTLAELAGAAAWVEELHGPVPGIGQEEDLAADESVRGVGAEAPLPEDFPEARISHEDLDEIYAQIRDIEDSTPQ